MDSRIVCPGNSVKWGITIESRCAVYGCQDSVDR